jgi:thiamine monophosphate kinase
LENVSDIKAKSASPVFFRQAYSASEILCHPR